MAKKDEKLRNHSQISSHMNIVTLSALLTKLTNINNRGKSELDNWKIKGKRFTFYQVLCVFQQTLIDCLATLHVMLCSDSARCYCCGAPVIIYCFAIQNTTLNPLKQTAPPYLFPFLYQNRICATVGLFGLWSVVTTRANCIRRILPALWAKIACYCAGPI